MEIPLSGMKASVAAQEVAANNVANVNTDGFRPSRVLLEAAPGDSGVRISSVEKSSLVPVAGGSGVDLSRETVSMIMAGRGLAANASSARVNDQLSGFIIDLIV